MKYTQQQNEEGKNHIMSISAENTFDKVQEPYMVKTLRKLEIEGNYLDIIKAICEKLTANVTSSGENLKACPQVSGRR